MTKRNIRGKIILINQKRVDDVFKTRKEEKNKDINQLEYVSNLILTIFEDNNLPLSRVELSMLTFLTHNKYLNDTHKELFRLENFEIGYGVHIPAMYSKIEVLKDQEGYVKEGSYKQSFSENRVVNFTRIDIKKSETNHKMLVDIINKVKDEYLEDGFNTTRYRIVRIVEEDKYYNKIMKKDVIEDLKLSTI